MGAYISHGHLIPQIKMPNLMKIVGGEKYTGEFPILRGKGYFSVGDKGPEIGKLQTFLNWVGIDTTVDNEYGMNTYTAVKVFQRATHLTPDGIYGYETHAMVELYNKYGGIIL